MLGKGCVSIWFYLHSQRVLTAIRALGRRRASAYLRPHRAPPTTVAATPPPASPPPPPPPQSALRRPSRPDRKSVTEVVVARNQGERAAPCRSRPRS
eukprot:2467402-Prymnesium_polylepis.1